MRSMRNNEFTDIQKVADVKETNDISLVKKLYEANTLQIKAVKNYSSDDVQDFEALKQIYREKFRVIIVCI